MKCQRTAVGISVGFAFSDVRAHSPDSFALWRRAPHLMRFPGGESLQDLVARIEEALRFALRRHSSETVVFVGHNSGNRALLLKLLDQPLSAYWRLAQDPCCINEAEIVDGRATMLRVNETAHLAAQFASIAFPNRGSRPQRPSQPAGRLEEECSLATSVVQ